MKEYGKTVWLIPDGYISSKSGSQPSHDCICVLNTGLTDAQITITLLFESQPPMSGFSAVCPAMRTNHIRMDRISSANGDSVPRDTPYALLVESSVPVAVQYSRLDTSASDTALMTTIGFGC